MERIEGRRISKGILTEFTLGSRIDGMQPLVYRLDVKKFWGMTDPKSTRRLQELQEEWGTEADSFPAMMFLLKGTGNFDIEWAMVHPKNFTESPEELLADIKRAQEDLGVQEDEEVTNWIRSLEFVYAATTGHFPEGDDRPDPLVTLPESVW